MIYSALGTLWSDSLIYKFCALAGDAIDPRLADVLRKTVMCYLMRSAPGGM